MIDRIETDLSTFISYIIEKEEVAMDLEQLKKDHPDVYAAAKAEGVSEGKAEAEAKFNSQKADLEKEMTKAQQDNAGLAEKIKELERKDAIREERERPDLDTWNTTSLSPAVFVAAMRAFALTMKRSFLFGFRYRS